MRQLETVDKKCESGYTISVIQKDDVGSEDPVNGKLDANFSIFEWMSGRRHCLRRDGDAFFMTCGVSYETK